MNEECKMQNYKCRSRFAAFISHVVTPTLFIFNFSFFIARSAQAADPRSLYHADEKDMTPRQRLDLNERKLAFNPELRGRWNPKSRQPASTENFLDDDLSQRILLNFKSDPDLAERPVNLKVSSSKGKVVIEGVVNDEAERRLVAQKVARMNGVKELRNDLRIKKSDQDLLDG